MKILDILQPKQQLDEFNLKQAIAAGLIGTAAMSPHTVGTAELPGQYVSGTIRQADVLPRQEEPQEEADPEREALLQFISAKYKVDPDFVDDVIDYAYKHEHDDFPTAKDILAVVGVESSFRPQVLSRLQKDPARGLMQVRANIWKIAPEELHDAELNIKHGADILHYYYKKFRGNRAAAIQAYNVGKRNFRKGVKNPAYLHKVVQERKRLEKA